MDKESLEKEVLLTVSRSLVNGRLTCTGALGLAKKLDIDAAEIGAVADDGGIRISSCQLGCFAVEKATHDDLENYQTPTNIADEITASLVEGRLPCPVAFEAARKFSVTPRQVGDAATKLEIKISNCQLGCFP